MIRCMMFKNCQKSVYIANLSQMQLAYDEH